MKFTRILISVCSVLSFIYSHHAAADEVIPDDLIVDGSLCVGFECVIDEVFDFDTIKLKSDTPQIRFYDTSNTAGFPSSDWTMGVADSDIEISYFFVRGEGRTVFQLSASESGGVALGYRSVLEDNTVSVGALDYERRITHVADGIEPTDAVNVGQLAQSQSAINDQLTDLETQMNTLVTRIDDLITRLDNVVPSP